MTRCKGTTRSGERCRREVSGEADYCYLHEDQATAGEAGAASEARAGGGGSSDPWDGGFDDVVKVALAAGLLAAIVLLPLGIFRRRC